MPLFSIPMAIDWVSPNPFVGEWHPAQVLSLFKPGNGIKPEQTPHVCQLRFYAPSQTTFQR